MEKDWADGRRADQSGFQHGAEHFLLYLVDCKEPVTIWGPKKALKDLLSLFRTPVCAHALSSTGTASLPIAPTSLGPRQLILQETAHYHSVHASIMGHILHRWDCLPVFPPHTAVFGHLSTVSVWLRISTLCKKREGAKERNVES